MANQTDKQKNTITALMKTDAFQRELSVLVPDLNKYIVSAGTYIQMAKNKNALMACSPASVARAILTAAAFGLTLDGKGHAYLVPYKTSCQFIPGYKGYLSLIQESQIVKNITSEIVYEHDEFKAVKGTEPRIDHEIKFGPDTVRDPLKAKAFYSILNYRSGAIDFEIMGREEVEKIMKAVEAKNNRESEIWRNHFGEMARKTVIRRFAKRLQLPKVADLLQVDDMHSDGNIVTIEKGEIKAEKNKEIESAPVVNKEENKKMLGEIQAAITAGYIPEEKAIIQYSVGMFGERDYKSLPTSDMNELLLLLKKDFKF